MPTHISKRVRRTRQQERSAQNLSPQWSVYLRKHDLMDNQYARIAAMALDDPERCDINWLQNVIHAIEESRRCKGYVWRKYVRYLEGKGNPLYYPDIQAALSIYRRHKQTQYDDYMRWGCDKQTARMLANRELLSLGLPTSRTASAY